MKTKINWNELFESTSCRDMVGEFADGHITWTKLREFLNGFVSYGDILYLDNSEEDFYRFEIVLKLLKKSVRDKGVKKTQRLAKRAITRWCV